MNERLKHLIELKTSGNQKEFAELMGWSPQYITKLLKGEGEFGLKPVLTILSAFPEIDARWLLFGPSSTEAKTDKAE